MIERYSHEPMKSIWTDQNRFKVWLDIELAVCRAWNRLGKISNESLNIILSKAKFNIKRINEIEEHVKHDVIAFLTSVSEEVGDESKYIQNM